MRTYSNYANYIQFTILFNTRWYSIIVTILNYVIRNINNRMD